MSLFRLKMLPRTLFLLLLSVYFAGHLPSALTCNEAVCGSVVSKCLLTKSCNCDFNFGNCTCCKECLNCLGYFYDECCSCVDMCPKPNVTNNPLSKKSHVEDLESIPGLFNALTEEDNNTHSHDKWKSITYPVDIDISQYANKKEIKLMTQQNNEQQVLPEKPNPHVFTVNCTVAFWVQCMSSTKCKSSCRAMGAASYRWFHDGCCECVGYKCINYGINESRCSSCPSDDMTQDENTIEDDEDIDYGEGDDEDDEFTDQ
ncbi:twisted gastrulation protein homolog 1-like isoform X2 [Anthonomus grandis grandis]|uniref:twisted gastrulation protein homolog 1-like isoform X2 n=1 Tax=Anthonomus grandis grandis TaxID=2921223 RepID=UPI002166B06E|nr:twisted gastrulation protein homolog 1-like isoform X2 [Anthonomus grandis grandis]